MTDEQAQLVDAFSALYAKESGTEAVRAAEPDGFAPSLWAKVSELGGVAMAVPEAAGGWGASMLDLGLVAEQQGRALASVPLIEGQVAARLLARADRPDAAPVLADLLAGAAIGTVALHAPVGGEVRMLPAGLVSDHVVALNGDRLVLAPVAHGQRTRVANLAAMPVADVRLDNPVELGSGTGAVEAHGRAVDEWLALTACALVGAGARGLEIGVDYVQHREAWGVPIGSFQSIAHRLADAAAAVDAARLLAWEACWAFDEEPDRSAELAAMAFGFAYETARDATYLSLHFHGGYGFMMEQDIQLYFRRARGWANVYGDARTAYRRVAAHRLGERGA
ncbi:MAG TPA: acyl-CoA dehydrogenase [Acidimicrobiales bacterium]|jgi:alkylation response protein AidB-like acyl-CoA dehydrogenase|nr:acyl-CoA dehydrogenase [Acidimicrobiales bacterium]